MNIHNFWDIKGCDSVQVHRCFGGNCCIHLQERRVMHERPFPDNRGIECVLNAGFPLLEKILLISTANFHVDNCIQCERLAMDLDTFGT
jgi:hypothetical protein